MSKQEFLNFTEICKGVRFAAILDFLNVQYAQERPGQLKANHNGTFYVISLFGEMTDEQREAYKEKNGKDAPAFDMYKNTKTEKGGSVLNFLMEFNPELSFRDAAATLKHTFMGKPQKEETTEKKAFSPEEYAGKLDYSHSWLIDQGIPEELARDYVIGYTGKGILKSRVAVRINDHQGNFVAFAGRATTLEQSDKSGMWFFPKGYQNNHLWNLHRLPDKDFAVLVMDVFEALHLITYGLPAIALMSLSMNAEQDHLLEGFRKIILLHPKPENILTRLAQHSYTLAPKLPKRVKELTADDLAQYLV